LDQLFGLVELGEEWIGEEKLFQGLLVLTGPQGRVFPELLFDILHVNFMFPNITLVFYY
jgi:hypothetical protein